MLNFVKKAFRGGIGVILWLNLILLTIGGGVAGYSLSGEKGGFAFLGVIIGVICQHRKLKEFLSTNGRELSRIKTDF